MSETEQIFRLMVKALTKERGGASQVSEMADVDRSSVSRWKGKELPTPENETKVLFLFAIRRRLEQVYGPDTAEKWLTGINAHLGNRRPIDLLRQNRFAEVLAAVEQSQGLSYA